METSNNIFGKCLSRCRNSKKFTVLIVFSAFVIDKMLLTVIVPILPNIIEDENEGSLNGSRAICNATADMTTNNYNTAISTIKSYHELKIGLLFASKAALQVIVSPLTGLITNRIGYDVPMLVGIIIVILSTIFFAFGISYPVLLTARMIQGIGSSFISISGMGIVAEKYSDDQERAEAMAVLIIGTSLGFLAGPPLGGVLHEFGGKQIPFLILTSLSIITGGCLVVINTGYAIAEPTIPKRIHDTLHSPVWQQGLVFMPAVVLYCLGAKYFAILSFKIGRFRLAFIGLLFQSVCLIPIPFATSIWHIILPISGLGIALGLVDCSLIPYLGYLVDIRHTPVYGSVYAIADMALNIGYSFGPAISGVIIHAIGFHWLMWIVAILSVGYGPLLFIPPPKEIIEMQVLQGEKEKATGSYNSVQNVDND